MKENFKAREKLLDVMERNLEIRQNIFNSKDSKKKYFEGWRQQGLMKILSYINPFRG